MAVNNLGEICIEIWNVSMVATTSPHAIQFPEDQKVHERSKKALVHRVKCELSYFNCTNQLTACADLAKIFLPLKSNGSE